MSRLRRALRRVRPAADALRPRVEGLANLPTDGPAIIASNHISRADWVLEPDGLGRRIMWARYRSARAGKLSRVLRKGSLAGMRRVVIEDDGGDASLAACLRVLDAGELLGIFPEAEPSPDGRLHRGRPEVARLAMVSGVAIIPTAVVSQRGSGSALRRASDLVVRFGDPILPHVPAGLAGQPELRALMERSLTDQVMDQILALSGQEYVDLSVPEAREVTKDQARARRRARVQQRAEEAALRAARQAALAQEEADALSAAAESARRHAEQALRDDEQRRQQLLEAESEPS